MELRSLQLLYATLLFLLLAQGVSAPGEDDDDDDERTNFSASTKGLAGLAIAITTVQMCKLCGTACNAAHPWKESDSHGDSIFFPWLHYKRLDEETKTPSCQLCAFCRQVFKLSTLKQQHGNVKKYLKWKNEKDSVSRHSFFMKAWKKYIGQQSHLGDGQRSGGAYGAEVMAIAVVRSDESSGLTNQDKLHFVEVWKWKENNPGKKVPLDKVITKMCLCDDGSQQLKEGLWQKRGEAGVHNFTRYVAASVTTSTTLDDGRNTITQGQQGRVHDLAAQQLKVPKPMSLDDLMNLDDNDEVAEREESDKEHDDGTDEEEAERQEDEEEAPLFRLVSAKPAPSQPSAKVPVECLNFKRFLFL